MTENIEEITFNGLTENGNIPSFDFSVKLNKRPKDQRSNISISQKGGHIVLVNDNKSVETEVISQEEANQIGKEFLSKKGFPNMKETYYLKQQGILHSLNQVWKLIL